jgi:hypothetical protein
MDSLYGRATRILPVIKENHSRPSIGTFPTLEMSTAQRGVDDSPPCYSIGCVKDAEPRRLPDSHISPCPSVDGGPRSHVSVRGPYAQLILTSTSHLTDCLNRRPSCFEYLNVGRLPPWPHIHESRSTSPLQYHPTYHHYDLSALTTAGSIFLQKKKQPCKQASLRSGTLILIRGKTMVREPLSK